MRCEWISYEIPIENSKRKTMWFLQFKLEKNVARLSIQRAMSLNWFHHDRKFSVLILNGMAWNGCVCVCVWCVYVQCAQYLSERASERIRWVCRCSIDADVDVDVNVICVSCVSVSVTDKSQFVMFMKWGEREKHMCCVPKFWFYNAKCKKVNGTKISSKQQHRSWMHSSLWQPKSHVFRIGIGIESKTSRSAQCYDGSSATITIGSLKFADVRKRRQSW